MAKEKINVLSNFFDKARLTRRKSMAFCIHMRTADSRVKLQRVHAPSNNGIILWDESQTAGNSPLRSSSSTLNTHPTQPNQSSNGTQWITLKILNETCLINQSISTWEINKQWLTGICREVAHMKNVNNSTKNPIRGSKNPRIWLLHLNWG